MQEKSTFLVFFVKVFFNMFFCHKKAVFSCVKLPFYTILEIHKDKLLFILFI